jgi:uncharacterized protein YkwD
MGVPTTDAEVAAVSALALRPTRWSVRSLLAVAVLALVATVLPATSADASTAEHEMRFIDSLNVERATRGLPRLTVASDLSSVARKHSGVMASQSNLHHNPNLSSQVTNWSRLAENVGRGPSVASLHRALMDSPGHRANILDSRVTEVGVGVVVSGSTVWVTQVFRLPNTVQAASFRDVNGGTHGANVLTLARSGITTGCSDVRYCPERSVTRAQMGTFIARAAAKMPSSSNPFNDLHRAPLHRANISALADAKITGGCSSDRFCPDRTVTRAQMATFIANALGLSPVSGSRFSDVPSGSVHAGAINAIAAEGVTLGCGDGRYCPDAPVSRAEMASFLVRAFDL